MHRVITKRITGNLRGSKVYPLHVVINLAQIDGRPLSSAPEAKAAEAELSTNVGRKTFVSLSANTNG